MILVYQWLILFCFVLYVCIFYYFMFLLVLHDGFLMGTTSFFGAFCALKQNYVWWRGDTCWLSAVIAPLLCYFES